jgi:hypothetical protein
MARKTRAERLGSQGIAFVEVDGILARLTKKQSVDPAAYVRAVQAVAIATPLAAHVRHRVRDERRPAEGVWGGYARGRSVGMTPEYQSAAGLPRRYYPNEAAMHGNLPGRKRAQLFNVSGKMWDGLQVRGSGRSKAILDFDGTSMGRGLSEPVMRGRGKSRKLVVRPVMVRNARKAATVFQARDINIVQPAQTENVAMADALSQVVGVQMAIAWDADRLSMATIGERSLVESIKRSLTA